MNTICECKLQILYTKYTTQIQYTNTLYECNFEVHKICNLHINSSKGSS